MTGQERKAKQKLNHKFKIGGVSAIAELWSESILDMRYMTLDALQSLKVKSKHLRRKILRNHYNPLPQGATRNEGDVVHIGRKPVWPGQAA